MSKETENLLIEVLIELLKFLRDAAEDRARGRHERQMKEILRKRGY